jgi:hypothetical protein
MRQDRRLYATLCILPLVFLGLEALLSFKAGPFWLWFHVDPNYFYLLNGLMLAVGETPADVFHPGTPVHVLVALLLRVLHPLASADDLQRLVLSEPEYYLSIASKLVVSLNATALVFLGLSAHRTFGRLLPALAAQTAPFSTMFVMKQVYHVKPESFLLLAASLMGIALFEAIRREGSSPKVAPFAWVAGFGVASKLLFAPVALAPLFVLGSRKLALRYVLASLAVFLLCLLPAVGNWDVSVAYFSRMATNSGAYGGGEATVIDWAAYPANLAKVFAGKPIFDGMLLLSLLALLARWKKGLSRTLSWRALEGIVLAEVAMALLVAKHPIAYYMVAAVSLVGIQAALLIVLSEELVGQRRWWRLAMAVVLLVLGLSRIGAYDKDTAELADWQAKARGLDMARYEACTQVFFDFASSPTYALYMGDMMTRWRWAVRLAAMYPAPNQVFMNFFTKEPRRWGEKIDLQAEFAKRPCVALRGAWDGAMKSYLSSLAPDTKIEGQCMAGQEFLLTSGIEAKCN